MSALSRWLDRFCYNHPNFGIPGLMKYIAIGNVAVFLLDLFSTRMSFTALIDFYPALVLQGQVWRLLTFVFVPINSHPIWFVFSVMLYYFLGNALERQWGSARFSLFYGLGVLLNVLVGFVLYFASGRSPYVTTNMYYVNMSLFFAFATLYPDTQFMVYFIIPIKVKWLAWLDAALFAFAILQALFYGQPLMAAVPIVAILNYLVFFWDDLTGMARRTGERAAYRARPQTINFKKAQKQVQQRRGYLHKCAVCGVTDADHPNMEFRYCSKCSGYYCYCMDHINNHTHVT